MWVCPLSIDGNSILPLFQSFRRTTGDFSHSFMPSSDLSENPSVPSLGYIFNLITSHHIHHSCHSTNRHLLSPGLLQYPHPAPLPPVAPKVYSQWNSQVMLLKHDSDHLSLLQSCQWLPIYLTVTSKIFTVASMALGTPSPITLSLVTWVSHTELACCSWDRQGISAWKCPS